MDIHDLYINTDAVGLAEHVRSGDVSASELVACAMQRIDALNPRINAVIHPLYERALEAAEQVNLTSPLCGVPFLLKDLLAGYTGSPMNNGSRSYSRFVSKENAPIVDRYLAAGLVIVGKTNTPEFGLMAVTEPELHGRTNNPWDLSRTAGGSSGGAGAAVAARLVPAAHGGDGGGSIRIPASCCGLFGLKPSRGRMPPSVPYTVWNDGVVEHALTRTVRDSAALLDASALHGNESFLPSPKHSYLGSLTEPLPRLRIGILREPLLPATWDSTSSAALDSALSLCESLGHEIVEAKPQIDQARFGLAFARILCGEVAAEIARARELTGRAERASFEASTWALGVLGRALPARDIVLAQRDLQVIANDFTRWSESFDVLVAPTLGKPPLPHGDFQPQGIDAMALNILGRLRAGRLLLALGMLDTLAAESFEFIPTTPLFNMTGQPAMSVPLYWTTDNLPIGVHFSAQVGEEALLLRLATELEEASPWQANHPSVM